MRSILSIIHNTLPGGVQRVAAMETAFLKRFGYNSSLFSILKTQKWDLFDKLNVEPKYFFNNEFFSRTFLGFLLNTRVMAKPDVIIAHNNPGAQIAFQLKKNSNKNIRVISYLHDSLVYPIAGSFYDLASKFYRKIIQKMEFKHIVASDTILVNSYFSLRMILEHQSLEGLIEKFHVLYPTVNSLIPKEKIVKDKGNYILIVGRIDHEAFYNLYKIMKAVDVPLIIAGYAHPLNPNSKKIFRLFKSLKGKNIKFIFSPSDTQLFELYRNALLFVYPGHENFNMSAMEAMSFGCPILIENTSGICELLPQKLRRKICLDKDDVWEWVEKIKWIVDNNRSYNLGIECWEVSQSYNLNTHMNKLVKILEEVL
ncbi:MAG: glycosyltransferase family 4 protein [Candidatus Odinarchaeum yellowstonii]|uniref:Glycosyltransferase family 4 protein n=1 Tax=Odinarchaeota yellowstonii (strain LCB_4) TaxID=1841599 RepID=A0AAF0D2L6_ODILC|nr:MAG: glycosyltransferase family 4 protein [Candidatus Odinarchaeum yellowstonii]